LLAACLEIEFAETDSVVACPRQRLHHRDLADEIRVAQGHVVAVTGDVGDVRDVGDGLVVDNGDVVVDDVLDDGLLLDEGAGRSGDVAVESSDVDVAETDFPTGNAAIAPTIVGEEGIAGGANADADVEPGIETKPRVAGFEVVAEVVAGASRAYKERAVKAIVGHDVSGTIDEARLTDDGKVEGDGGEEDAAAAERIIPVAIDEDVAARGPNIVGGNPNPVGPAGCPVAGPPAVASVPHPGPGDVVRVVVRGRRGVGKLGNSGWGRQVGGLGRTANVVPESGHPTPGAVDTVPVSRHPAAIRRWDAPEAADPYEIAALVVPGPITRDPLDVVPLGFFIGWNFVDWIGGLAIDRQAPAWLGGSWLSVCLMHRASTQYFNPLGNFMGVEPPGRSFPRLPRRHSQYTRRQQPQHSGPTPRVRGHGSPLSSVWKASLLPVKERSPSWNLRVRFLLRIAFGLQGVRRLKGYPTSSLFPVREGEGWGDGDTMRREFSPHSNPSPTERGAFRTAP
jgi:hypothetical protein